MNGAKNNPEVTTAEYYLVTYYCNVTRRSYTNKISSAGRSAQDAVRKCKADNNGSTMRVTSVVWVQETPMLEWRD